MDEVISFVIYKRPVEKIGQKGKILVSFLVKAANNYLMKNYVFANVGREALIFEQT